MEFSVRAVGDAVLETQPSQAEINQVAFADDLLFPAETFADRFRFRTQPAVIELYYP